MQWFLPFIPLIPFLASPLVAVSAKLSRKLPAWLSLITTLFTITLLFPFALKTFAGQTIIISWEWISAIGLNFAFRVDGLSIFFAYLILIIGVLIIIYAAYYLQAQDSTGRFYSSLMLFMGSMLGIVLSENIIVMVIFWELTSITSFLLISFWQHTHEGRRGARLALGITCLGGLALFAGFIIVGKIVGSYELSDIFARSQLIREHQLFLPTLILILIGAFTKSAQFPFHFWLPHAMAAPTPVSAYLHSATMVKAGLFLLVRFSPVFAQTPQWFWIVSLTGLITLLIGAYIAMFKDDLKALLAYSTISNLGLITLLLGLGTKGAMVVAIFHILNHATYKAPLFMIAGVIDHESGTRNINYLSGLAKLMPLTALLATVASASMAGIPLTNGFLSKEQIFEQTLNFAHINIFYSWLPIFVFISAIFTIVYSLRFGYYVFFNNRPTKPINRPHDPPLMMNLPVIIFVIMCLIIGLMPGLVVNNLLSIVVGGALQSPPAQVNITIWHGITPTLIMSMFAIIIGILIYKNLNFFRRFYFLYFEQLSGKVIYFFIIKKLIELATFVSKNLQRESLRFSVSTILIFTVSMGYIYYQAFSYKLIGRREFLSPDLLSVMFLVILIIASFLTAYWQEKRMQALISLGVTGLIVSLLFIKFSAPDLALTQLSIESVTIILLMLALFLFPLPVTRKSDIIDLGHKWQPILISLVCGVGISLLTLGVLSQDFSSIAPYYLYKTVAEGGGANAVNVILVDFRGIDTMGEITVLAMASLGVFSLLKGIKLRNVRKLKEMKVPFSRDLHPLILRTMSRILFPIMLLFAIYIFLRGHNDPGGGFIAGLVAAVALIIQYLANGLQWTGERMKINMYVMLAIGLLIAASTGLGSLALGYPFLTSTYGHINLPIIGKIVGDFELASAAFFDLGVFLVVVSSTVISLVKLGVAREK